MPGLLRISLHSSQELQATILALKNVDRELRKQVRQHTRAMILPEWQRAVAEHATTRLEHRVLAQTARVRVSDQAVTLQSAQIGRALPGGLKPSELYFAVEFGSQRHTRSYEGRRGSKTFPVRNRATTNQLRRRKSNGWAVYPAAADIIPRLASLWVQTTARTLVEAFERN